MLENSRRSFLKRMHMHIYLHRGCDGLRQHVQMMRWIHDKGLTEVFDLIEEHFKETWTMSNEECVDGREYHDQ